ncbi:MAG: hypothetical protein QXF09_00190 [Nitrososphaerota archaeon]
MARKIRLRYTGLIAFSSRIFSIFTGLIFITTVTRNVPVYDFGIWQYISQLISYFLFPLCIISYWSTRYIARNIKVGKTSLLLTSLFSMIAFIFFLIISPYVAKGVNADIAFFILGSLILVFLSLINGLESIAHGYKPHVPSYGFIIFEIIKVILGIITVFYMRTGLYGALTSLLIAYVAQSIFLLIVLKDEIHGNFNLEITKKWFKMGWVPFYNNFSGFLTSLDILIVTLLTSSSEPIAFWKAATTVAIVIGYSNSLALALYPKLLSGGSGKDIENSFKLVLMFSIPLTIGAIILAEPLLRILRSEYVLAANILRICSISFLIGSLRSIIDSVIVGTESIDINENITFKKLLRSKLFLLPSLTYISNIFYLPLTYFITNYLLRDNSQQSFINIPLYINVVGLIINIAIFIYTFNLSKKIISYNFPIKNVLRYIFSVIIMSLIIILFYPKTFRETILLVGFGAMIYFSILLLIDEETRQLLKNSLKMLRMENLTKL